MTRRSTAPCAPRCNTALRSPRTGRWHYGPSSQYGVACVPSHAALRAPRGRYHMLQLIGWVGIKPALLLFYQLSLMFAGAYLLGFGRAISLKKPPCGLKGPFADSDSSRAKGRLQYSRAQTRHSPGYSLETTLLPASKSPRIDQLNAEMGAPAETPVPWRAWSASMSGGPRPRETPCRARA